MKMVIEIFKPEGGLHCISNSMKQIFHFNGISISEEMIFGLASALNFFYFEFKFSPVPLIGGRNKIGEFEENLARSLNIKIEMPETASSKKAYSELKNEIENGNPVMIYTDMAYLSYLNLPGEYHFGGHSIVVFGIDEEENIALVSDRDDEGFKVTLNENEQPAAYHIITLDELAKARGSKEKPYPPKNRRLIFDFSGIKLPCKESIFSAIKMNVETLLNPPIKNLGISGIKLFENKIDEWQQWDTEKLKLSALSCFIMINQVGGNGGGCFRRIYGNFLIESGKLLQDEFLISAGNEYVKISNEWDNIGNLLYEISQTGENFHLADIKNILFLIHIQEEELMRRLGEAVG